jgi:putative FmdB family regulatory protein
MPIYEFYCPDCNHLMNFLSKRIDTTGAPGCPHCQGQGLTRQVSQFALARGGDEAGGGEGDDPLGDLPIDEARMEGAIEALAGEAEGLNEEDPRAAAQLMRKFSSMTGLNFNEGVEEALARMEAGDDPEAIEEEMGSLMDDEADPFVLAGQKKAKGKQARARRRGPIRDAVLHEM